MKRHVLAAALLPFMVVLIPIGLLAYLIVCGVCALHDAVYVPVRWRLLP